MDTSSKPAPPENWQEILTAGDEEAFREMVEPYTRLLIQSARYDVAYYVQQRQLHQDDLTPEEVAGETLYYAWRHRAHRPEAMTLRGWLLGNQHRLLRGFIKRQQEYRSEKELSLEAPLPPDAGASSTEEWFWEWDQPTAGARTWEDVTPGSEPVDLEIPLNEQASAASLEAEDYHVLSMHDEFEMSLPEVAHTLDVSVKATSERLDRARASLHERETAGQAPESDAADPSHPQQQREEQRDAEAGADEADEHVRQ